MREKYYEIHQRRRLISEVEKLHEKRFNFFLALMEQLQELFQTEQDGSRKTFFANEAAYFYVSPGLSRSL